MIPFTLIPHELDKVEHFQTIDEINCKQGTNIF